MMTGGKRTLAWALTLALLVGILPGAAHAAQVGPPWENPPEHTAECGYVEGRPCGHFEHTAACRADELICGIVGGTAQTATGSDADQLHQHTQACHALDCPHERGEHDDACGYMEARLCAPKDQGNGGEADREDGLGHSGGAPGASRQNIQTATGSNAALTGAPISGGISPFGLQSDILTVNFNSDGNGGTSMDRNNMKPAIDTALAALPDGSGKTTVTTIKLVGGATKITELNWRYLLERYNPSNGWDSLTALDLSGMTSLNTIRGDSIYAVSGQTSLHTLLLPDSLTQIGKNAFYDCENLTLQELPAGVTTIGKSAFYDCKSLTLQELPSGVTTIENSAFYGCDSLALQELPSGVTTIANSAFYGCDSLALQELPSGVTTIANSAFSRCDSLALQELPSGVTSIGPSAFYFCTSLALQELPEGVTAIGEYAFDGCTGLSRLTIPASVTNIGQRALSRCTSLKSITFEGSAAPTIGEKIFGNITPRLIVYVPHGAAGYDTGGWLEFADSIVSGAALSGLTVSDGALDPAFHPGTGSYSVTVSNSVDSVTVTPTAHASETVTVNGNPVSSGAASAVISLTAGATADITIIAKNSDTDSRTYTIAVTREASPDDMDSDGYHDGDVAAFRVILAAHPSLKSLSGMDESRPITWSMAGVAGWDNAAFPHRLIDLDLQNKGLKGSLDISGLPRLVRVTCAQNPELKSLTLGTQDDLETLDCFSTGLSGPLDVSGLPGLKELVCYNNPELTGLTLGTQDDLETLYCADIGLSGTLDVSGCPSLELLRCADNPGLTGLTLGTHNRLKYLECSNTGMIGTLDVSSCPNLQFLYCNDNPGLTGLTLGRQDRLAYLVCSNAGLIGTLDVSRCSSPMFHLVCSDNPQMTEVKLGAHNNLWGFVCTNTGMRGMLDLSRFSNLALWAYDGIGTVLPTGTIRAEGGGRVKVQYGALPEGLTPFTLTALPDSGYRFTGWTGLPSGVDGSMDKVSFTEGTGYTYTARFAPIGSGGSSDNSGPSYFHRTLTDKPTGVKVSGGGIHESARLTVKAGALHSAGDAGCDLLRAADKAGRVLSLYDVSLSRPFQGNVTVSFPVEGREGQTLTVAHCMGGSLALTNVTVTKGMAAVTADKLSPFAVLNGVYTLETLAAPPEGTPYADVAEDDWFYEAVAYVSGAGLMSGTSETMFSPDISMSRAMLWTVLARLDGQDTEGGATWYEKGRTWAMAAGVSDGADPEGPVTREQVAAMLYRYARFKGADVSGRADLSKFTDARSVSSWASEALAWANAAGIVSGRPGDLLDPQGQATRAEVAAMLQRYLEGA